MTRVLLIAPSLEFSFKAAQVQNHQIATLDRDQLDVQLRHGGVGSLLSGRDLPDLLMFGDGMPAGEALSLADTIRVLSPEMPMVMVTGSNGDVTLDALRAGIRDMISPAAPVTEIESVVEGFRGAVSHRAEARAEQREIRQLPVAQADLFNLDSNVRRVISVTGAKGGVGRTTVASNLAVSLARRAPGQVVLIDLDLAFGDTTSLLDLAPYATVADVFQSRSAADSLILKSYLTPHPSGLSVLASSPSPTVLDNVEGGDAEHLIRQLSSLFHYVVVDTGSRLDPIVAAAIRAATDLVAVTSMSKFSISATRHLLAGAATNDAVRHVVLNGSVKNGGLGPRDVERLLGEPIDVMIPQSGEVLAAGNSGSSLVLQKPSGSFAKAINEIVLRIREGEEASSMKHRGVGVA